MEKATKTKRQLKSWTHWGGVGIKQQCGVLTGYLPWEQLPCAVTVLADSKLTFCFNFKFVSKIIPLYFRRRALSFQRPSPSVHLWFIAILFNLSLGPQTLL